MAQQRVVEPLAGAGRYGTPCTGFLGKDEMQCFTSGHCCAPSRPLLFGGDSPKGYVFLKGSAPRKPVKDPTRIKQKMFRDIYYRLAARYLGIPFGPHAVRHIVAMSILRVWPNNWQKAADALFDTPTSV